MRCASLWSSQSFLTFLRFRLLLLFKMDFVNTFFVSFYKLIFEASSLFYSMWSYLCLSILLILTWSSASKLNYYIVALLIFALVPPPYGMAFIMGFMSFCPFRVTLALRGIDRLLLSVKS